MTIEIKDVDGGLGNILLFSGIVEEEEFLNVVTKHLTQDTEKFKQYRYSLSDLMAVTAINISTDAIELIANLSKKAAIVNPKAVVAIAASQDFAYGLARMMEILRDESDWEEMVFRNREDAEAWIKKRVKEKYGIEDLTFS